MGEEGRKKKVMKKTVMVVDDSPDILFSVKNGLEEADKNLEVLTAKSGEECLQTLANKNVKPDAILLDIMMPDMSGWETYDRIKENQKWENIPIVFLTARTDNVAKNAGSFLGEDFIEKPFEINELKNRLERFFKK